MFFRRAQTLTIVLVVTTTALSSSSDATTTHYVYQTVLAQAASSTTSTAATAAATTATAATAADAVSSAVANSVSSAASLASSATVSATSSSASASASKTTALSASSLAASLSGLSGSSSSSTTLGLAIGIPLAVLSLCIIAALAWSFFHKRIAKKSDETLKLENLGAKHSRNLKNSENKGAIDPFASQETFGNVETYGTLNKYEKNSFGKNIKAFGKSETTLPHWQAGPVSPEKKPGFLNRLSKMISRSEWPSSPREFKSPLFLKRFHLSAQKNVPKLPAAVLELSVEKLAEDYVGMEFLVVKPYAKRLGDELSLCTGEKVVMRHVHPDGWATVEIGGSVGVVPLMCLKKM